MSNIIQFKKPKLTRGVVIPENVMDVDGNSLYIDRCYDNEDIFYYSLYWDKIAIPRVSGIGSYIPLEQELVSLGILERPSVNINTDGDIAQAVQFVFGTIAKEKLNDSKADWLVHHMSKDPIYAPIHTKKQDTIRLKITNALPIPSNDGKFSLDDLLEFKYRRDSELQALHATMDRLLKKIHTEELDVIRKAELKRFESAVVELDKTIYERFKIYKKSDWEVNVNIPMDSALVLIANAPAVYKDLMTGGIPICTIATSIASIFSLKKKYGVTLNRYNHNDYNLEYLSSARSENIIF